MRVGMLSHKNPLGPPSSIDLVRLGALSLGLVRLGARVCVVAPVQREGRLPNGVPVLPLDVLTDPGRFDVVKACYHFSLELVQDYHGPLVCRLVRVVDEVLPERDALQRDRLLACQETARVRALGIVLNNRANAVRWRERYGTGQRTVLIPTGCRSILPAMGPNPYPPGPPVLLFLGSLAAPRMVHLVNEAARLLAGDMTVHLVGKNKSGLYGESHAPLSRLVVDHGEMPEEAALDFVRHAHLGLAMAAGPHAFDNDLSKLLTYVRCGLPVVGEEGIVNLNLAKRYGQYRMFRHGDVGDLVAKAQGMLPGNRAMAAASGERLVRACSWDRQAGILHRFLESILASSSIR